MTSEIDPGEVLNRLLRSWWVIVLCMLLLGAAGYLFHTLRPPVYEATATFNVWLDFNDLTTDREFTEYDEDLSIKRLAMPMSARRCLKKSLPKRSNRAGFKPKMS